MIKNIYQELDQFPKRLNRKDKTRFLDYLTSKMASFGYEMKYTKGRYYFKCVNLESENNDADVIIGAHYDTPTILPFYFEYLFRLFGHTRQLLMIIVTLVVIGSAVVLLDKISGIDWLLQAIKWTFYISFLSLLIPNPSNKNDNTSGIATLLDIAEKISGNPDLKKKVKFIFFDNEELGLLGSFTQRKAWKKEHYDYTAKKIITVDCVAHGEIPIIVYHKNSALANQLGNTFFAKNIENKVLRLPFYPISDNFPFAETGAVNISWMNKTLIPGGYYIRNVHNPRDTIVDFEKIEVISTIIIDYLQTSEQAEYETKTT